MAVLKGGAKPLTEKALPGGSMGHGVFNVRRARFGVAQRRQGRGGLDAAEDPDERARRRHRAGFNWMKKENRLA